MPLDNSMVRKPTSPRPVYGSSRRSSDMSYEKMLADLKVHMTTLINTKFSQLLTTIENRLPEEKKKCESKQTQTDTSATYSGDHCYINCENAQNMAYMIVENTEVPTGTELQDLLNTIPMGNMEIAYEPAIATSLEEYNKMEL